LFHTPPTGKCVVVFSDRQRAILEFERSWWTLDEPRDRAIRARFQCSVDEYHAELNELLETPEAVEHDELLVRRLQRQRSLRRRERLGNGTELSGGTPT
jgi:hypothetical protein